MLVIKTYDFFLIFTLEIYRKNSLSSKMIQYNINLKRIDEKIRKVERRHEVLKCQFEKIKQNAKEESMWDVNKMLNHSFNNQEVSLICHIFVVYLLFVSTYHLQ